MEPVVNIQMAYQMVYPHIFGAGIDLGMEIEFNMLSMRIEDLEKAAEAFAEKGGALEQGVQDSLRQMRKLALHSLAFEVVAYRTASTAVSMEERIPGRADKLAGEALRRLTRLTDALYLQLAATYEALPDGAKSLVDDRKAFESLIERRPIYERHLQQR